MNKKYIFSASAVLAVIIVCVLVKTMTPNESQPIFAENNDTSNDSVFKSIAEKNNVTGMTVLGYRSGFVQFVYNYGYSDIERKIPIDNNTIFLVASITKTVTGMAIMKLVESKKIKSIDDDISIYLKYTLRNPKHPYTPITIKHLMTHTSGLSDGGVTGDFYNASFSKNPPSMKEALLPSGKYFNPEIWLNNEPGKVFEYSNFGAILAGSIIGKISGMRFDEYVNKKIIDPLEMSGGLTIDRVSDIDRVAVVYKLDDNFNPHARMENYKGIKPPTPDFSTVIPGRNPLIFGPQGGLRTRAKGLEKIMEVFINEGMCYSTKKPVRILKKSTVALMLKTHWEGNGFDGMYTKKGLFIHITEDLIPGVKLYGHKGDDRGLMSDMYFNPDRDFGIIVIMNGGNHAKGKSGFHVVEEQIFRSAYNIIFKDMSE